MQVVVKTPHIRLEAVRYGHRTISKAAAKRLAELLDVSVEKFI